MYCVTHKLCFAVLPKAVSLQTLVRPKHTSKKRSARRAWMRRKSNRSGTGKPVISDIDLALIDIASDIPIEVKVNDVNG